MPPRRFFFAILSYALSYDGEVTKRAPTLDVAPELAVAGVLADVETNDWGHQVGYLANPV